MDEELLERAQSYYLLALINILSALNEDYRSHDSVFRQFKKSMV